MASLMVSCCCLNPRDEPSEGVRDKHGRLVFKDAPEFNPNLAPSEMIRRGIFGGCYFNPKVMSSLCISSSRTQG